jgi:quercetin dioxygenase-like cupin family protein
MWHFDIRAMAPKKLAEGVELRIIPGKNMTMVFFRLQPGAEIPEHSHVNEQMGTVLKGSIELVVDKERKNINAGEAYRVPSGVMHSGKCGEAVSEILEVFSPSREDYHALI